MSAGTRGAQVGDSVPWAPTNPMARMRTGTRKASIASWGAAVRLQCGWDAAECRRLYTAPAAPCAYLTAGLFAQAWSNSRWWELNWQKIAFFQQERWKKLYFTSGGFCSGKAKPIGLRAAGLFVQSAAGQWVPLKAFVRVPQCLGQANTHPGTGGGTACVGAVGWGLWFVLPREEEDEGVLTAARGSQQWWGCQGRVGGGWERLRPRGRWAQPQCRSSGSVGTPLSAIGLGGAVWSPGLDSAVPVGPFQLVMFCDPILWILPREENLGFKVSLEPLRCGLWFSTEKVHLSLSPRLPFSFPLFLSPSFPFPSLFPFPFMGNYG